MTKEATVELTPEDRRRWFAEFESILAGVRGSILGRPREETGVVLESWERRLATVHACLIARGCDPSRAEEAAFVAVGREIIEEAEFLLEPEIERFNRIRERAIKSGRYRPKNP
jgi:hypothetical protein